MTTALALAILGALLLVALVVALALRSRSRRRRRVTAPAMLAEPPQVVLAHGLGGFDAVELAGLRREYFRGVAARIEALGVRVHVARVSPLGSIARRAAELADRLSALGGPPVHILAHSMGGLDARYALSRHGLGGRVASLTTIATPHRGTPLADIGSVLLGERLGIGRLLASLNADGIFDLTTERMRRFNAEIPDDPRVAYGCVVAAVRGGAAAVNPLLRPTYLLLQERAGDNDGLVPASSQAWGEVLAEVDADHWGVVGWSDRFDAPALYERIVRRILVR